MDMDGTESMIRDRERRVREARSLTMFSDVFMAVALRDKKACQYVLRILTGISGLVGCFRTTDPGDMSHGELSRRVHFLKCEEGGYADMCEISEKWFREGVEQGLEQGIEKGELKKSREITYELAKLGLPPETIAETVKISLDKVKEWLAARPAGAK